MTGKQLRDFADRLEDDTLVEVYCTEDKYKWNDNFRIDNFKTLLLIFHVNIRLVERII